MVSKTYLSLLINLFAGTEIKIYCRNFFSPDTEMTALIPVYTERRHNNKFFRTEINSWSNLFYAIVGFHSISLAYQDYNLLVKNNEKRNYSTSSTSTNFLIRNPQFSLFFGIACIHLAIGSGIFHASLTIFGRQLDVVCMCVYMYFMKV